MNKHNVAIIIGRFQPIHTSHLKEVFLPALETSDTLIVLLGSSQRPRTPKDPWTDEERAMMIWMGLCDSGHPFIQDNKFHFHTETKHVFIIPLRDCLYSNMQWQLNVQERVRNVLDAQRNNLAADIKFEVSLFGVDRDESTFYLDFFPQWNRKVLTRDGRQDKVNGTMCRELILKGQELPAGWLTKNVADFIWNWQDTTEFIRIKSEYEFLAAYKKEIAQFKYPIIFHTADNIILWKGHILLAQRRSHPGKNLWSLPGGFVDNDKTILRSAMVIASEKTKLNIKEEWLQNVKTFDHPKRSLRGRTITTAHLWKLPDHIQFDVEAGKNTSKVQWFEFSEVMQLSASLYEDHFDIILDMLSVAK